MKHLKQEPFASSLLSDCSIRLSNIYIYGITWIFTKLVFFYFPVCHLYLLSCCQRFFQQFFCPETCRQHCLPETAFCKSIKSATADGPIKEKSQEAEQGREGSTGWGGERGREGGGVSAANFAQIKTLKTQFWAT